LAARDRADILADTTHSDFDRHRTILGIVLYLLLLSALTGPLYWTIIKARTMAVGGGLFVLGLMLSPALASILTRLIMQRTLRGVGWRWRPWKYQWLSYAIPIAYSAVVYLPLFAAGYGDIKQKAANALILLHWLHRNATSPTLLVAFSIAWDLTVGMVADCIAALGEELGWRGFLVPELAKITSFTKLSLISGVIWTLYHMPIIFGADYRGSGPLWLSVLCFSTEIISNSFISAWMRLKSGSMWTGMILHATHNLFVQGIFDPMLRHTRLTDYVASEFGIGIAISSSFVAYVLWRRRDELPQAIASRSSI